ncbi:MAG: hypothetical protein JWQ90_4054 [Hydrocarboniphaga sp.]|uniref:hypothetical protein n=1 Tax=Hydrocarboniphaga sp. TaxID=2033016 RepID=UPI00262BE24B|nr:hypothetical protein [Hydrocarboniphaga sp.]MDB5971604.1 hypothetical protein [Hydrocarboniphaga sp.]
METIDHPNSSGSQARLWKDLPLILPISLMQGSAAGVLAGLLLGGPLGWLCGYSYWASAWAAAVPSGVLMISLLIAAGLKPEPPKQKPGLALAQPDR